MLNDRLRPPPFDVPTLPSVTLFTVKTLGSKPIEKVVETAPIPVTFDVLTGRLTVAPVSEVALGIDSSGQIGVAVAVAVAVFVAVLVGVKVGVKVGVFVGVCVGVLVDVFVAVLVGVFVGVLVDVIVGVFVGVLVELGVGVFVAVLVAVLVEVAVGGGSTVSVPFDVIDAGVPSLKRKPGCGVEPGSV